jgi:hypothetical protein
MPSPHPAKQDNPHVAKNHLRILGNFREMKKLWEKSPRPVEFQISPS